VVAWRAAGELAASSPEFHLEPGQLPDLVLGLANPLVQHAEEMWTRHRTALMARRGDELPNLIESEPKHLRLPDELEPMEVRLRIEAEPAGTAPG